MDDRLVPGTTTDDCDELTRLRRENAELRRANDLAERYGETCRLAVMERIRVLYEDKVVGAHVINVVDARVGAQLVPHCNAVGSALPAYRDPRSPPGSSRTSRRARLTPSTITNLQAVTKGLEAVRTAGCAFDQAEAVAEVHRVPAPVRDDTVAPTLRTAEGLVEHQGHGYGRPVVLGWAPNVIARCSRPLAISSGISATAIRRH